MRRSRRFDVGEGVSQCGGGGEGNIDVVGGEDHLEGSGHGGVVGEADAQGGRRRAGTLELAGGHGCGG